VWLPSHSTETQAAAERIYQSLREGGLEVLFDDRRATPGVKFTDADLIGLPLRVRGRPLAGARRRRSSSGATRRTSASCRKAKFARRCPRRNYKTCTTEIAQRAVPVVVSRSLKYGRITYRNSEELFDGAKLAA